MNSIVENVYPGRINTFAWLLTSVDADGNPTPVDFTNVVRIVAEILAPTPVQIDSDTWTDAFDWTDAGGVGELVYQLGPVSGLPEAGTYDVRTTAVDGNGDMTELVHEAMFESPPRVRIVAVSEIS